MDWIALTALLLATAISILGALKDLKSLKSYKPEAGSRVIDKAWLVENRIPLSIITITLLAAFVGALAIRQTKTKTDESDQKNIQLLALVERQNQSQPTIRLFLRSKGATHSSVEWDNEFQRMPAFGKGIAFGFIGSSARRVLFSAPSLDGLLLDKVGDILVRLDDMTNTLLVYKSGRIQQMGFPKEIVFERPGLPYGEIYPGDLGGKSDAFVAEFHVASAWKWDRVTMWLDDSAKQHRALLKVVQYGIASCPAKPPVFEQATVSYELQSKPRFAVLSKLEAANLNCSGERMIYDLIPDGSPQIMMGELTK